MVQRDINYNEPKLSHSGGFPAAFPPLSTVMFYVMASVPDAGVDESPAPREMHRERWDSGISALSARPNDGIHLLFYGHSWSSVAPIWPKAHNLLLALSFSLFPCSFLRYPLLLSSSCTFISVFHKPVLNTTFFSPCYLPVQKAPPFFHFPFICLWLIALMFFLWSTATSSSSELDWPHVFKKGWMSGCGGEGPRGARTAEHPDNMSHSCLMTSTVQPCRALAVYLHPEGRSNTRAIHLFHTEKYSYFVIT